MSLLAPFSRLQYNPIFLSSFSRSILLGSLGLCRSSHPLDAVLSHEVRDRLRIRAIHIRLRCAHGLLIGEAQVVQSLPQDGGAVALKGQHGLAQCAPSAGSVVKAGRSLEDGLGLVLSQAKSKGKTMNTEGKQQWKKEKKKRRKSCPRYQQFVLARDWSSLDRHTAQPRPQPLC